MSNSLTTALGLGGLTLVQKSDALRKGLRVKDFDALRDALGVDDETLCRIVGLSTSTLKRRRIDNESFQLQFSETIQRLAWLFDLAMEAFDQEADDVRAWFTHSSPALEDRTPLELAQTEIGGDAVKKLIRAIDHGVYL